jgi:histidine phosphotransferase ChpT
MSAPDPLILVSLIASRLCHDLASPVGAASNGAELLAEDDDPDLQKQAIALISDATTDATRRLAFYRLAFGSAAGLGDEVAMDELRRLTMDFFATAKRLKVDWAPGGDMRLGKTRGRALLLLILLAQAALPRGGILTVDAAGRGVVATGTPIMPPAALALLEGGDPADDHLGAVAALAALLAQASGIRIAVNGGSDRLELLLVPV